MFITWVDITFVVVGLGIMALALWRRRRELPAKSAPPNSWAELVLTLIALAATAVGPNVLVIATTPGMPSMAELARPVLIPSVTIIWVVLATAIALKRGRLVNRLWTGIWAGAATTAVLDAIRLTGFHLGWMPGNMPRMFGVMLLDRMAEGPTTYSDIIGSLYHYWVGACFGLTYCLLAGRARWWVGLIWGLLIELGMMTTPPMVVAMDTGYFGLKFGFGLLGTSLVAHIAFGAALGLVCARYIHHKGSIVLLLRRQRPSDSVEEQLRTSEPITSQ
jgi:hypothetical protein